MENEELKNKLIGKLEKELAEFKDSLMELSSKEIIDSSYKITCMEYKIIWHTIKIIQSLN